MKAIVKLELSAEDKSRNLEQVNVQLVATFSPQYSSDSQRLTGFVNGLYADLETFLGRYFKSNQISYAEPISSATISITC